jgi:hypothetical protein
MKSPSIELSALVVSAIITLALGSGGTGSR